MINTVDLSTLEQGDTVVFRDGQKAIVNYVNNTRSANMSNERPFEAGDLVVLKIKGKTIAANIKVISKEMVYVKAENWFSDIALNANTSKVNNDGFIKTIRTPRKGSKEARDIVAMLAAHFRLSKISIKKLKFDNSVLAIQMENSAIENYECIEHLYLQAKSMLK